MKLQITELIGEWKKGNHKVPASRIIERKLHKFRTLKELMLFSRENYILVHTQGSSGKSRRLEHICKNLWIGEKLLWIDVDTEMNPKDVYKRLKKEGISGFVYYTSSYYSKNKGRIRIGVITDSKIKLDNQNGYYAKQLLYRLGYDEGIISKVDSSIYGPERFLAPVKEKNSKFPISPPEKGECFCTNLKPFFTIPQKEIQEKIKYNPKNKNIKCLVKAACFGKVGKLATEMLTYSKVSSAIARDNNTISLEFKDISERTKGGYYIDLIDPFVLRHPNKKKNIRYIDEILGKRDFFAFKESVVKKRFRPEDILVKESPCDFELVDKKKYLTSSILKKHLKNNSVFLESPTGTAKTTSIVGLVKELTRKGKSVLFVSVNRSQAAQFARVLEKEKLDFLCYIRTRKTEESVMIHKKEYRKSFMDYADLEKIPDKLICGVLSLHHLISDKSLIRVFDYVIIDEITNLPNYTANMTSLLYDVPERFYNDMLALALLLKSAKRVICTDSYVSMPVIAAIKEISGKKFIFVRNNFKTNKKIEIFLTQSSQEPNFSKEPTCKKFFKLLKKDVKKAESKRGKSVLLSAFSIKKKALQFRNYIRSVYKGKGTLLVTGNPSRFSNLQIVANLDSYLKKYKVAIMIYSPSITTGVDIPQAAETNVYHIMDGYHLTSHTHYQMTMRGRNASVYRILIPRHLFSPIENILKPRDTINHNIRRLTEQFLLHLRIDLDKPIKGFERHYYREVLDTKIKMGTYILFTRILENKEITEKMVRKALNKDSLIEKFTKDIGIDCAIRLEIAALEWEGYDKKYGIASNYINLLSREGCLVIKETDYLNKPKSYKYTRKKVKELQKHRVRENTKFVEQVLNYKKGVKNLSVPGTYKEIKRIKCGQRIFHCFSGYEKSSKETKKTLRFLKVVCKKLNISLNLKREKKVSHKKLIKLHKEILSKDLTQLEPEVGKLLDTEGRTDYLALNRMVSFLSLFFTVESVLGAKVISPNRNLLDSIIDLDSIKRKDHLRVLYSDDVFDGENFVLGKK